MNQIFNKLGKFINSWTGTIIIVLCVIFFVAQAFVIPSGSMLNTMLIGDNLFVKKYSYGIPTPTIPWIEIKVLPDFNNNGHLFEGDRPKRGDIVIFRYPLEPKIHYVKRNIGISGDEILYTKEGLWVAFASDNPYTEDSSKTLIYKGKTYFYEPYAKKHPGIHYENIPFNAFVQLQSYLQSEHKIGMEPITLDKPRLANNIAIRNASPKS